MRKKREAKVAEHCGDPSSIKAVTYHFHFNGVSRVDDKIGTSSGIVVPPANMCSTRMSSGYNYNYNYNG